MNANRFKVIFSKCRGALIAVGENASSVTKAPGTSGAPSVVKPSAVNVALQCFVFAISSIFLAVQSAYANPTGGEFAAGAGAISQAGNLTTIQQNTQHAIVNWQSFGSEAHETIKFVQPNVNAAILNRVVGDMPSNLNGVLEGNGRVYLINQNGIMLGKDGIINVNGGFVGSTRDVTNEAFMAGGALIYKGESIGNIQILGKVKSAQGDIVLIAQKVDVKEGAALIAGEKIRLVAANEVQLTDGKITVKPSTGDKGQITVEGALQATQVQLLANNNNLGALAINTTGTIRATGTVQNPDGSVTIMAEGEGSNIKVAGTIEALNYDSNKQGGSIIIGRDVETGHLAKSLDASGAILSTNKGFIETSGEHLATDGISIKAKTWLIDPNEIVIGNTTTTGGSLIAAQAAAGISHILASTVNTALASGTNVIITTSAGTGGNGNISVNSAISNTTAGNTLTLNADQSVIVNANITASNITLNAGTGSIYGAGNLTASGGAITLSSAITGSAATATNTLTGAITAASLTKNGLGTIALSGTNNYTSAVNVTQGTLINTNMGALNTPAIAISAGATFQANVATNTFYLGNTFVTGSGTFQKTGGGGLNLKAVGGGLRFNNNANGLIDIQAGGIQNDNLLTHFGSNLATININTGAYLDARGEGIQEA
jgi:filamentous hemagglutinin family protein